VVNGKKHKDNFYHTLEVLDNVAEVSTDLWLRWAAIMHDIAKPATQRLDPKAGWTFHGHEDLGAKWVPKIFQRMKLPMNEHMRKVQKLVRLHLRPIALVNEKVTDSAIRRLLFDSGQDFDDLMMLCRADVTSKNQDKVKRYLANFNKVEARIREVEEIDQLRNFKLAVTGEDIMARYNLPPGRMVGEMKEAIKEAVLEGHITNTQAEAIQFLDKLALKKGLHAN
jgi:poly(A) polymerase